MNPTNQQYSVHEKYTTFDISKYSVLRFFIGPHGICDTQESVNNLSELLGNRLLPLG